MRLSSETERQPFQAETVRPLIGVAVRVIVDPASNLPAAVEQLVPQEMPFGLETTEP